MNRMVRKNSPPAQNYFFPLKTFLKAISALLSFLNILCSKKCTLTKVNEIYHICHHVYVCTMAQYTLSKIGIVRFLLK